MKNKTVKSISYWMSVVSVGIVVGVSLQFVAAWTEPTQPAPGGNVAAPINVGTIAQLKNGALGIVGVLKGYSSAFFDGSITSATDVKGTQRLCIGNDCRDKWPTIPANAFKGCTTCDFSAKTFVSCGITIGGTNICADNSGCDLDIIKFSDGTYTTPIKSVTFNRENYYQIASTGNWSRGNADGKNGDSTEEWIFNSVDYNFKISDDANGVENSRDSWGVRRGSYEGYYRLVICD